MKITSSGRSCDLYSYYGEVDHPYDELFHTYLPTLSALHRIVPCPYKKLILYRGTTTMQQKIVNWSAGVKFVCDFACISIVGKFLQNNMPLYYCAPSRFGDLEIVRERKKLPKFWYLLYLNRAQINIFSI